MNKETIHIENLSIGYPGKGDVKVVADGICAGINSGELTCLLGANGVGKSTLLRTLSAFQPKLGGNIFIEGKEIGNYTDKQLSRVISVVLTEKCDIRNMSVVELIGLGRSPYTGFWGTLSKEDKTVVDKSIALVGIPHLAHRMVHTLSDGERQKVMIAKALAQETPVIYLDEPTAFLDFPSKVEMMQLLHQLSRQTDKTIFLSTHDLELALQIADKIWLMDKVNGVTIGTPEDLSLNGSLSNFFARKGIAFDLETGLFRVANEYTSQIRLAGHGQKYAMVRKALQRNGILANRNVNQTSFIVLIFILPMWMNFLLRTLAWQTLLEKNGVINSILAFFHLPGISIINTPGAIILGMVYNFLPFMVLPIYNVLIKIDRDVINAARDLGANSVQTFLKVTLPLTTPGIVSGITMVFIPALTTFVISDLLGGSKILLIGNVIEQEFKQTNNWNAGSALSTVLMIFIILSMVLMNKYDKDGEGTAF